ncbi:helix-turn-helix transcriptional regulator [Polymorphospora sp. NPDC051019]|uniref:helix-turn-helix domain-containing protein n=1 Tax=Polymorphospora sp. NPDC051019 TaxID=3155725 RepID=UPI0034414BC5
MSPVSIPTARRRLGAELRRLREAAGLTGEQVIARVGWASASKLSRLENGRSRPDLGDVLDLLDAYSVDGSLRDDLVAVTRAAGDARAWLRSYPVMTARQRGYAELEAGCAEIREWAPVLVPGLLQTPEYARVRFLSSRPLAAGAAESTDAETEVAARLARQSLLTRDDTSLRYEAVVDEAALGSRGGPPDVVRGQLIRLHELATRPNVTLRVLPRAATIGDWYLPHTGFSLYGFDHPQDPETLAIEGLSIHLVLTDRAEIDRYTAVFGWLREAALSAADSLAWLADAAAPRPVPPPRPGHPHRRRTTAAPEGAGPGTATPSAPAASNATAGPGALVGPPA